MQKIVPHLWYDTEAGEAAAFYTTLFPDSRITHRTVLRDTPSGDAESLSFQLAGQDFMAISAGPYFRFNPSFSLMVSCETPEEVDTLWEALSPGGNVLMPLDAYPFSGRYGWLEDRYGLSWQLMLTPEPAAQKIVPCLLFSGTATGKAEEAVRFYAEVFPDSELTFVSRYAPGEAQDSRAAVNYAAFRLAGYTLAAMDNGYPVDFGFNEAFSLLVRCEDQAEIDAYWQKLSAVPEAEQCGWLKDRFGLSWQISPTALDAVMTTGTPEEIRRVTQAFLRMKKFDIAALEAARKG